MKQEEKVMWVVVHGVRAKVLFLYFDFFYSLNSLLNYKNQRSVDCPNVCRLWPYIPNCILLYLDTIVANTQLCLGGYTWHSHVTMINV